MPFCSDATTVVSWHRPGSSAAAEAVSYAFTQSSTASHGPIDAASSVAATLVRTSPMGLVRVRPCAWMAARCAPRATTCTSAPADHSRAANQPPTPPAPITAILMTTLPPT